MIVLLALGCVTVGEESLEAKRDLDDDGFVSVAYGGKDCNDRRPDIFPGAVEQCNGTDDNCDGVVDTTENDLDGDGFRVCAGDCDDSDPASNPEVLWYPDEDGDGFGDNEHPGTPSCEGPAEFVRDNTDCADENALRSPGLVELCDPADRDEDCDGLADDDDDSTADTRTWWLDADNDGYGDPEQPKVISCDQPAGYVEAAGDCNDADDTVSPGTPEIWYDSFDQDCSHPFDDEFFHDYDQDGDGFWDDSHPSGLGNDCDDTDASVNPNGVEIYYDGIDNDCSPLLTHDRDQDFDQVKWPLDCDDANPDIPGDEIWYSGVDEDCDGWSDYDQDFDGYDSAQFGGDDCDDNDFDINPGAPEWCELGEDWNCDGVTWCEVDLGETDVLVVGTPETDLWGEVGDAGDHDGDGLAEIFVGADFVANDDGWVDLLGSPAERGLVTEVRYARITGIGERNLGYQVGMGELTGDTTNDLAITAPAFFEAGVSGSVYIVDAPVPPGEHVITDLASFELTATQSRKAGNELLVAPIDGDSTADLLIGGKFNSSAWLVPGPITAGGDLDAAATISFADDIVESSADTALATGDHDGDGVNEIAISSGLHALWILDGSLPNGAYTQADADTTITDNELIASIGNVMLSGVDFDDDGKDELVAVLTDFSNGAVYVFGGDQLTGTLEHTEADSHLIGQVSDNVGGSLTTWEEVGDTYLVMGADAETFLPQPEDNGGVYMVLGSELGGTIPLTDATIRLEGEMLGGLAGYQVARTSDVDGDGKDNLLVTSPGAGSYGILYVLSADQL